MANRWKITILIVAIIALSLALQWDEVPASTGGLALFATDTPTATHTATVTNTPRPTFTFTPSPVPTNTPTATAMVQVIAAAPGAKPQTAPFISPLPTPTNTAAPTATFTPSATPSPTPTIEPTPQMANLPTASVPILMYHYISEPPADADIYRLDLSVTPDNLDAQLKYLKEAGYTTITLEHLSRHLAGYQALPAKPIILTFDDGYIDNYENAFPILKKYGFVGSFALITQPIDQGNTQYVSWDNVIEMHQAGMEFSSHTYQHPDLRNRSVDFLVYQIVGSGEAIEARIQQPVRTFVYPSGMYDQRVIDVLDSANFWLAVTTKYGSEQRYQERFTLPRIRMRGSDTLDLFIAKVEGL